MDKVYDQLTINNYAHIYINVHKIFLILITGELIYNMATMGMQKR